VTSVGELDADLAAQMAGGVGGSYSPRVSPQRSLVALQQQRPLIEPQQQQPVSQQQQPQPPQSATEAVMQAGAPPKPVLRSKKQISEDERVNTLNKKFVDPIHAEQAIASGLKPARWVGQQRLGQIMTDRLVPSWLRSTKALNQIGDRRDVLERQGLLRQNAVSRYGGHGDIPEVAVGPKLPGDNKGGAGGLTELLRAHLYSNMFSGGGGGMYPGAFMGGQQGGGGLQNLFQNLAAIQALEGGKGSGSGAGGEAGAAKAPRNRMEELNQSIAKRTGIGAKPAPAEDAAGAGKSEVDDALERLGPVIGGKDKKTEDKKTEDKKTESKKTEDKQTESKKTESKKTEIAPDPDRKNERGAGGAGTRMGGSDYQTGEATRTGDDLTTRHKTKDESPLELVEDAAGKGEGKGKGRNNEFDKGAGKGEDRTQPHPKHHNAQTAEERQAIIEHGRLIQKGLANPTQY